MPIHAMIDLETLATDPHATILTIGGVKFNPNTSEEPHSEFYFKLDVDEQSALGRTQDPGTIDWWSKQDPRIMEEAFGEEDRVGLKHFLSHMTKWMVGVDVLWGMDMVLMLQSLKHCIVKWTHPFLNFGK